MKKLFIAIVSFILLLTACSEQDTKHSDTEELKAESTIVQLMTKPNIVKIGGVDELNLALAPYHYTFNDWKNGANEIPRLTFSGFSESWNKLIQKVPVENKKVSFFRLMLPLILISNENILRERAVVKAGQLLSSELISIAIKYRVISNQQDKLTVDHQKQLLERVNIIPPSLALAQAAEESGWGTSRFTVEGNAFFGQWDFSGKGMKPKQQRKELGNYGVARFDSPLASVEGYMRNINTASAYQALRDLRKQQVTHNTALSGYSLAGALVNYSERGEAYIIGLRHLIEYNKLKALDKAYLSKNHLIHMEF